MPRFAVENALEAFFQLDLPRNADIMEKQRVKDIGIGVCSKRPRNVG
jgi:hypothetical protein